jgi:two-component system chemotaxis response regulator CheB
MTRRLRVLVVDDSAFARKVVREVLSRDPGIEVVGIARDGLDALEKIGELAPDVITLDLHMPGLDGLGLLRALAGRASPKVVVVSTAEENGEAAIEALHAGAVEIVHKPTSLATERLYEMSKDLVAKVKIAALARPIASSPAPSPEVPASVEPDRGVRPAVLPGVVVVGASTGGPQALTRLIAGLPPDFPVPVAIVLHMPIGYTAALAARLDTVSAIDVVEASDGVVLRPGLVVIARAGMHLRLEREGQVVRGRLEVRPIDSVHRPAVDVLLESAATVYREAALGVVLTGMGDDGLRGARAIVANGGWVITESESSCVVYGMPRAVAEAGLSARSLSLPEIAPALCALFANAP